MTLYLLFERLEVGELHLGDLLKVSEHTPAQAPSKLDLKPGHTITVEDAIKGIVTKSANDAAVVVAENLGDTEKNFAKLMTQRARTLGMTNTTYVNASGLQTMVRSLLPRIRHCSAAQSKNASLDIISTSRPQPSFIAAKQCAITITCLVRWRASTALRRVIPALQGSPDG